MPDLLNTRIATINFEAYFSNSRLLGLTTIDLPELKALTAEVQGAGTLGKMDFPIMGMPDSFTSTLNFRTVTDDIFLLSVQKAVDLTLYSAQELYTNASGELKPESVKITFRGIPKTSTLGSVKPAEATDSKIEFELVYLKIDIGGKNYCEIDKINYKYVINGKDYMADVRTALGR